MKCCCDFRNLLSTSPTHYCRIRWTCYSGVDWCCCCAGEFVELLTTAGNRTCATLIDDLRLLPAGNVSVCQTVTTLYDDLRADLLGSREVDIQKSVTSFFDELFSLVVRRHVFGITARDRRDAVADVKHAACIRSMRRSLQPDPLDGVDGRFGKDVAEAVNASRALLDALQLASVTVTAATEDWATSTGCRQALTRLRLCALCDGQVDWNALRPCRGLCVNVARGCLAIVALELGPRWERFVDGLARLVARSHGPRDLELVSKSLTGIVADGVLRVIRNAPHFYSQVRVLFTLRKSSAVTERLRNASYHSIFC